MGIAGLLGDLYEVVDNPDAAPAFLASCAADFHASNVNLGLIDRNDGACSIQASSAPPELARAHIHRFHEDPCTLALQTNLDRLSALRPHFLRVMRLSLERRMCSLGDDAALPVIELGRNGVSQCNFAAEEFLKKKQGVSIYANRIRLSDSRAQRALDVRLQQCSAAAYCERGTNVIAFRSASGFVRIIIALRGTRLTADLARERYVRVLLIVEGQDPDRGLSGFGLTPAERRLANALISGCSTKEYAERINRSIHTIRTQLKPIQRKTGTSSQLQLIRLALGRSDD